MVISSFAETSLLDTDHFVVAAAFNATAEAGGTSTLTDLQNKPVNTNMQLWQLIKAFNQRQSCVIPVHTTAHPLAHLTGNQDTLSLAF